MNSARIPVIGDQTVAVGEIANRLTRLGHEPLGHTDRAEEVIARAAEHRPDSILMDISLAGEMDGVAAARDLCRHQPIPVVSPTAHSVSATMDCVMETEPFGYLGKPSEGGDLHAAIEVAVH